MTRREGKGGNGWRKEGTRPSLIHSERTYALTQNSTLRETREREREREMNNCIRSPTSSPITVHVEATTPSPNWPLEKGNTQTVMRHENMTTIARLQF